MSVTAANLNIKIEAADLQMKILAPKIEHVEVVIADVEQKINTEATTLRLLNATMADISVKLTDLNITDVLRQVEVATKAAAQVQILLQALQTALAETERRLLTINTTVPTGAVMAYFGAEEAVPMGWMVADGRLLSRNVYPVLFQVIGFKYGGSGLQFAIPDLRNQSLIGAGFVNQSGIYVGSETASPDARVTQQAEYTVPGHSHSPGSIAIIPSGSHTHQDAGHSHGVNDPGHDHITYAKKADPAGTSLARGSGETVRRVYPVYPNKTGISVSDAQASIQESLHDHPSKTFTGRVGSASHDGDNAIPVTRVTDLRVELDSFPVIPPSMLVRFIVKVV